MRHAGPVDLGQQSFREIRVQIQPAQLNQRAQLLAPELPIEPQIIVVGLSPSIGQQGIDLVGRHAAERRGECRQSDKGVTLHRGGEARQRRQAIAPAIRFNAFERAPIFDQ